MYTLVYRSNEHPRTINTPRNARTNFSIIKCDTERQVIFEYYKLCIQGKRPYQIIGPNCENCMVCVDDKHTEPYVYHMPSRGLAFCR